MYKAIKKLGQNFLSDPALAAFIVDNLSISEGDVLVEIGPGHGFLTEEISVRLENTHINLYAVEVDRRFAEKLETMFDKDPNVIILTEDILRWLPDFVSPKNIKVIGSLPFYITSPILHATVKMKKMPSMVVYLVQKEVAKKLTKGAPDASYLSSFVQTFYDVEYLGDVPRHKFDPKPNVDGGIVKLVKKPGEYEREFIQKYEGFLHRAYKNPRKMLNKAFSKEELALFGLDPQLRPQNVSAAAWLTYFRKLKQDAA
jgi:16S rRNA (adenine1518-N6/adenine1519-N6)-dimethyltransferase